ncbi:secreted RxLR effector protein 161-like [Nicotiana tabacum]|uniref:Secreted RxLR effector protein 161-like n=1 Tax=Nicotiana tabacum TaxID=4097 RepID=A0AC58SSY5_TOBAC
MSQPEGFVIQEQENKVCKLRKSLYGLKQAPKQWIILCYLRLYVDDMLIFGPNVNVVNETKNFLSSKFEMKDLEEADVILGHTLEKNKESSISQTEYAKIIGSVIFFMNYTRPDIAYAVSRLSTYTHNPSSEHWNALHRLLRYLRGTMDWCLRFNKFLAVLEGFYDANWVTDNDEVSSTSGYVFTLGAGAISWKSSKQTCIARSTMESEFIALELAGQEVEWLRNLLADVPL